MRVTADRAVVVIVRLGVERAALACKLPEAASGGNGAFKFLHAIGCSVGESYRQWTMFEAYTFHQIVFEVDVIHYCPFISVTINCRSLAALGITKWVSVVLTRGDCHIYRPPL